MSPRSHSKYKGSAQMWTQASQFLCLSFSATPCCSLPSSEARDVEEASWLHQEEAEELTQSRTVLGTVPGFAL